MQLQLVGGTQLQAVHASQTLCMSTPPQSKNQQVSGKTGIKRLEVTDTDITVTVLLPPVVHYRGQLFGHGQAKDMP